MIFDAAAQSIMSVFNFALTMVKSLIIMIFALSVVIALFFPEILAFTIPLGVALGISFCFAPGTLVEKADGTKVPIESLQIGDVLVDGSNVEGTLMFECMSEIELFELNGTVVSGGHLVYHNGLWKAVVDHPDAIQFTGERPSHIYCLITDTHRIPIGKTMFADYEETSSSEVLQEIEKIVYGQVVYEDMVGLDPDATVVTRDGRILHLHELRIGDTFEHEERILGIIWLDSSETTWIERNGLRMTTSQPCSNPNGSCLDEGPSRAIQFIVDTPDGLFQLQGMKFRDYMDTHDLAKLCEIESLIMEDMNSPRTYDSGGSSGDSCSARSQ
jgi:hypothetical protein